MVSEWTVFQAAQPAEIETFGRSKKRAGDSLSPAQNDPASRHNISGAGASRGQTLDRGSYAAPREERCGICVKCQIFVSFTASRASTMSASGLAGGSIRGVGGCASMATSMLLAEHESEGDNEELFTEVAVDV